VLSEQSIKRGGERRREERERERKADQIFN